MTDQTKPDAISDADLEDARGGFIAFGHEASGVRRSEGGGFMSAEGGVDPVLKDESGSIVFDDVVGF